MDKITLERYLKEGKSSYEIARLEGCSPTTIRRFIKNYGLSFPLKRKHKNKEEYKLFRRKIAKERYYSKENEINCHECKKIIRKRATNIKKQLCRDCFENRAYNKTGENKIYKTIKPKNHFGRVEETGFIGEHRFLAEFVLNRILKKNEAVHHINNDHRNNEIDNLCVLDGKDHIRYHHWIRYEQKECNIETLIEFGCEKYLLSDYTEETRQKIIKENTYKFQKKPKKIKVKKERETKIEWPSPEELSHMVWKTPITQLAKKWGVSDKAVANRCDKFGIEKPPRGYWAIKKAGKL